ncbi:MAG: aminotransferase class I/II-fold pyridoxal phosphate-dependent enzyme [Boseongicola sp.]|nr:aminotransferase class I/II-fold pyridoxal phosphate-dependent enzyme [Boseongicola sp.]
MPLAFHGSFTQQQPLPEAAIEAVANVMRSGRLHRYNLAQGEEGPVSELERAYASWQGTEYCLAVTSGGQAMQIALRACGVKPGDKILTNAFTLAPVPGAIEAVGGQSILVEINNELRLDVDDLAEKARQSGARYLLLSHMRGHLCDMDSVMRVVESAGLTLIEDCAHTMGAKWSGKRSGNFGHAACFSTQTYKHMNSGEGGFLTTDDPELAARATILSGSYMLYARHGAGPDEKEFADARLNMPNCSARMDAVRAAMLLPQLDELDANIDRWNARYDAVSQVLAEESQIAMPSRPHQESMVGSSIQFRLPWANKVDCETFLARAADRGVEVKWFGRTEPHGFTSSHHSWEYIPAQPLPKTDAIMSTLFDMRLPLTFSVEDCVVIGRILAEISRDMAPAP